MSDDTPVEYSTLFNEELFTNVSLVRDDIDQLYDLNEATRAAASGFKVKYLFPWQQLVIANILDSYKSTQTDPGFSKYHDDEIFCRGRQIVLLPTGAGKSMCFLVPAMLLPGPTLVIYPLIALMTDQMRRMEEAGIPCVVFKGGQSKEEREESLRLLHHEDKEKRARVIISNPETLQNNELVNELSKAGISHIAIDESHCVSEWGDSFRPAYLTLGAIIKKLGCPVVTAFTATASAPVLKRIGEVLFDGFFHLIQSSSDRPNIHYSVKYAYAKQKAVLECAKKMKKPMIIFCATRPRTEDTARLLNDYFGSGKVKFYHAGMTKEEKKAVEQWFFDSNDGILTATCAYGMGMDKGNIYSVVHLDSPEHLENFIQEAGRAGRKGDNVQSVLIWNHADTVRWKHAENGSRAKAMGNYALAESCRRQVMIDYLGGEKTTCSGCDICDSNIKKIPLNFNAEDADIAFNLIKKNRRLFTREEAVVELTQRLNRRDLDFFKMNVWESKDAAEIFSQLISEGKIKVSGFLWQNTLDITSPARTSYLLKITPRNLRHHLHRLRKLLVQGKELLEPRT